MYMLFSSTKKRNPTSLVYVYGTLCLWYYLHKSLSNRRWVYSCWYTLLTHMRVFLFFRKINFFPMWIFPCFIISTRRHTLNNHPCTANINPRVIWRGSFLKRTYVLECSLRATFISTSTKFTHFIPIFVKEL